MKIEANRLLRRGVVLIFDTIISETTEGDGMNIRQND